MMVKIFIVLFFLGVLVNIVRCVIAEDDEQREEAAMDLAIYSTITLTLLTITYFFF